MKPIAGKRVVLRDWVPSDVETYGYWQNSGHKWQELDGPYYQKTPDESAKLLADLSVNITTNNFPDPRMRLIIADKTANLLLGTVSAYWESKETNWLCCGIVIYDEKNWGKGFGSEALALWIDYLFCSHPEIVRLDMRTWSGNKGLIQLAKKLGFVQEACFRKARIVNGEYFDGLGFGILRIEWKKRKS